MSTSKRLDLGTLGSQPVIMHKNLPDHLLSELTIIPLGFGIWVFKKSTPHGKYQITFSNTLSMIPMPPSHLTLANNQRLS